MLILTKEISYTAIARVEHLLGEPVKQPQIFENKGMLCQ